MAEGPLPWVYKGLETDAQPQHYTIDEHESGEGVISSSTNGSGGNSSVNSVDTLRHLSVENSSLATYKSRAYQTTDYYIRYLATRNPSQPKAKPAQCRRTIERCQLSQNRSNHVKTRIPPGAIAASGSRHLEDSEYIENQSQHYSSGDYTTEFARQLTFPAFAQTDTGYDQASSASESGTLPSFCSGPNRSSHCDNPYTYHGNCHKKCKVFMFNAILHCSPLDRDFAYKVKKELETLTLSCWGQNYRPRVALLYSLTGKPPLETFHEVQSSTMTTNIIILRTINYRRDKKAKATGMKIRDEACGTSVEVTTLNCSPSEKAESRCDAIHYRPQSKSFRADMINILWGKYFRKQLYHDGCRRKCEEDCLRNLPLQHSESFTDHSAAGARQQFQRTHSLPNTSNSRRNKRPTRLYQNDASACSELITDDTKSNCVRGDTIYPWEKIVVSAQDSIQNDTDLSESSSTDPKRRPTASSSSGHKGDVSSTDFDSWTPHTQHEGVIIMRTTDASIPDASATASVYESYELPLRDQLNIRGIENNQRRTGTPSSQDSQEVISGMKSGRSTETSAASGSNNNALNLEFMESELSSASGFGKEGFKTFNPISSSGTNFSDSSDGPGSRPQHSKKLIVHSKGPLRLNRSHGNPNVTNNQESGSSSQERESDCPRDEIKKSRSTKESGTESTRRKVASVSPMPKDNDETLLKTRWSACQPETELSLSNQEGVTQQQDTRSHQNSSPNQQTVTTAQSTSSPRHSTSHQARQQTTDVEQNNTDQQHSDINPNRDFPGESSGLQGSTQDLDSQQNIYDSITSFLGGDDGGRTENRVTNPTDSSANPRDGDGNQQQERRHGTLLSGLLRRFTSRITCASRRKKWKILGGKRQKKKPP